MRTAVILPTLTLTACVPLEVAPDDATVIDTAVAVVGTVNPVMGALIGGALALGTAAGVVKYKAKKLATEESG